MNLFSQPELPGKERLKKITYPVTSHDLSKFGKTQYLN